MQRTLIADVENQVVLLVGAGGIGQGVANGLSERGAKLAIADLNGDRASVVAASVRARGGFATATAVDISLRDQAIQLMEAVLSKFGRLDALVNTSGLNAFSNLLDLSDERWDDLMRSN